MPVHVRAQEECVFDLPSGPRAAGTARRVVRDVLGGWGVPSARIDDMAVVASELAGNAVCHASAPYALRLVLAGSALGVEVVDGSPSILPRSDPPTAPEAGVERGRGLAIVTALAGPWHVRHYGPEPFQDDTGSQDDIGQGGACAAATKSVCVTVSVEQCSSTVPRPLPV